MRCATPNDALAQETRAQQLTTDRKRHPRLGLHGTSTPDRDYIHLMLHVTGRLLLVLSFLSLQLSLMSGGERCPVVNVFAESSRAMAGMDMAGMDMAAMDMAPQLGEGRADATAHGDEEHSCDDHDIGTSCDSMTVCVFAAETASRSTRNAARVATARAPIVAVRMPPVEGDAPDLPPPKPLS